MRQAWKHLGAVWALFICTISWAQAPTVPASVTEPTREQFESWYKDEWSKAQEYPPIDGLMVEYTSTSYKKPLAAEYVARMRRAIEGHPDHPDRAKVKEYEWYQKDGPGVVTYRVWSEGKGRWRRSVDYYNHFTETMPFFDIVIVDNANLAWSHVKQELSLFSPASGFPEGRDYTVYEGQFVLEIKQFVHGGLDSITSDRINEYHADGRRIRATVGSSESSGVSAEIEILWDSSAGRGFVQSLRYRTAGGDYAGRRFTFDGWRFDNELQTWLATTVTEFNSDETPRRIMRFTGARIVTPEEFDAVIRPPTILEPDAVRGAANYTAINDYRGGQTRIVDISSAEAPVSPAQVQRLVRTSGGGRLGVYFVVGAVVAVVLFVVAVVWHKVRRVAL